MLLLFFFSVNVLSANINKKKNSKNRFKTWFTELGSEPFFINNGLSICYRLNSLLYSTLPTSHQQH